MPPSPSHGMIPIDAALRPEELVAAWRADSRRLTLPTREALRVGQRVAALVHATGRGVTATITGRVASVRREGGSQRVEMVPDDLRLRALERLVAVARGAAADYQPRVPRLLATIPAVVHGPAGPTYMNTFSVSENGCGLAWSGAVVPVVGKALDLRLGAGNRAVVFRGVVCWTERSGTSVTVGVRFAAGATGPKGLWATMLAEARRAGAPPA